MVKHKYTHLIGEIIFQCHNGKDITYYRIKWEDETEDWHFENEFIRI